MVFACAWLGLAASASAAPTWLAPKDISGLSQSIATADVAVDAAGNAVAVWPRDSGSETLIEAAERPAGGDWSEPVTLSDPAEDEDPTGSHVALDAAGNAIAVWSAFGEHGYAIRTAERPAGGNWSEPEDLSAEGEGGRTPQLAIDAAGEAVAVWTGFDGTSEAIWTAARPAGGEWSGPEEISAAGEVGWFPRVAIDAAGDAIAVWQRLVGGGDDVIRAALRPAGGEWSEPEDVSAPGDDGSAARIAMNAAGAAVAAWTVLDGADASIEAATHLPGGDWSAPEDVSAPGESSGEPEVAIDSSGSAFAIWSGPGDSERILRGAVRPPGGDWSEPEEISAEVEGFPSYALEANAVAGVVATWTRRHDANYGVQAAVRPPGGDWSEPEDLSTPGEDAGLPDLAFDAAGNAVAIWGRADGDDYVLQGAGYDFSAPLLDDLRIPATGTVGEPVSFTVSPFDVFSLGTTSWAFGDGSQAAGGNSVSHAYAAPGKYPVTVSAFDTSGNARTQTGTIAIAATPTGPPPPPSPRRQIALALRIEKESLGRLLRSGTLSVAASVNEGASVALNGRAKLRAGARGGGSAKLVPVFAPKTVRLAAAVEGKVTLALSKRGRKALRSLSRVRLLIAGEARDDAGGTATNAVAHTLR